LINFRDKPVFFSYDYTTSGHPKIVSVTIPSIIDHNINYTYYGYGRKTGMLYFLSKVVMLVDKNDQLIQQILQKPVKMINLLMK
jgi:hypothetical protein